MNYEFVNFEITKNLFYKNDSFYPLDLFSFNKNLKKNEHKDRSRHGEKEGKKKEQKNV